MKIALLSFEYPPETGFGGIGTYTWHQARGLAKLGHEVHVLAGATAPTTSLAPTQDGEVTVWRYRSRSLPMRSFGLLGKFRLWWTQNRLENALSMYQGLKRLMQRHTFDIIEMPECGAEGLLINHLIDATTVVKFHSPAKLIMGTYDVRAADHRLCSWAEQRGIDGASRYTACSQHMAAAVLEELGVRKPIAVVPNGIDLDWFDDAARVDARKKFAIPSDRPMIFFAGRMENRKGIHLCREIAEAILKKHEVSFVFAGQDLFGYMKDTLLPSLDGLDLKGSVHYLGKLDLIDVRSCLDQADIFLIPSLWENCPYSCLEAMAAGRAIVSSDAGGLPELIADGRNGIVAPSGEVQSFVDALDELIEDASRRERLGSAARQTIEKGFTDREIARRSVEVYR